jgi:hypothetical protein
MLIFEIVRLILEFIVRNEIWCFEKFWKVVHRMGRMTTNESPKIQND